MKQRSGILLATLSLFAMCAYAENRGPEVTVTQFYDASRNGDVDTVLETVSGSFYNRRKVLLENNDSYNKFLVNYYSGSSTNITNSVVDFKSKTAVVTVKTNYPDQSTHSSALLLKKAEDGIWKIVDSRAID